MTKPKPPCLVLDWFDAAKPETLFISVLTLGEIRKGIEKMDGGRHRARIVGWLETALPRWFDDRVLSVDANVADE